MILHSITGVCAHVHGICIRARYCELELVKNRLLNFRNKLTRTLLIHSILTWFMGIKKYHSTAAAGVRDSSLIYRFLKFDPKFGQTSFSSYNSVCRTNISIQMLSSSDDKTLLIKSAYISSVELIEINQRLLKNFR